LDATTQFYQDNIIHAINSDSFESQQQHFEAKYQKLENDLLSPDLNVTASQIGPTIKMHQLFYEGKHIADSIVQIPKCWSNQHYFKTPTAKQTISRTQNKTQKSHNQMQVDQSQSDKQEADDDNDEQKDNDEQEHTTDSTKKKNKIERKRQQQLFSSLLFTFSMKLHISKSSFILHEYTHFSKYRSTSL